ncbi:RING-9 protein [Cordyceps fumosorosea ARSEF 2679]|uniref:RING-type E3 ubiquitin transferase n=1 Tax=Cordyceps fumosorosea (strain ARSEF 2679) TaxID=1081104 RepID=A0A168D331_CORFA|nr:RING-9 protein [Cordyceps fumosorosea ARSEF 2679]OAA72110.1 RING-9 protein [Cordyceps fumosorosea ARSEF 2679]
MRTTRIVILAIFFTATLFVLFRAVFVAATRSSNVVRPKPGSSHKSILGLVYYNPPFSLFQPNAAISLTDDNSTSFAARPAAFGPQLAAHGLSGQLWVGSGFAEDSLESHGELGCSDIPGWEGGASPQAMLKSSIKSVVSHHSPAESKPGATKKGSHSTPEEIESDNRTPKYPRAVDDGTDNYLHETVRSSLARRDASASSHADIQSMQESAEIEGKVVLLMRGGCGFLEKVMWAQRRGAIAVIVGDNQRGGPLVNMFARGEDAENVTIPSVFTARTTAQLLSSLTQPGSFIEDSIDEGGNPVLKVQKGVKSPTKKTTEKTKSAAQIKAKSAVTSSRLSSRATKGPAPETKDDRSWLSRLLGLGASSRRATTDSPAGLGKLEWVIVDEWDNENDKKISDNIKSNKKQPHKPTKAVGDEFRIGVQDWRDPDLVDKSRSGEKSNTALSDSRKAEGKHTSKPSVKDSSSNADADPPEKSGKGRGLFTKMFGEDEPDEGSEIPAAEVDDGKGEPPKHGEPTPEPHHGLWVTITPNSGTSPFFDTLLVLVVSPLVTLSVVYALLILRARIRRRRWRAPKSVVERLPVRTYHTVAATPSLSPQTSSPSNSSPTTPLLQHSPSRPRPRSRTTTGVPESENLTVPSASIPTASSGSRNRTGNEHEKGSSGFSAEWRKYMGRQVECVVCLEEYVDGVSRVMSLPCGHEFHAECITPWLTTRRRTCPICKGDVVRSLAHSSRSMPRYEPYREDSDDDAAASSSLTSDVEQGVNQSTSRNGQSSSRGDGWFGAFSQSLSNGWQRVPSRSPSPAPRRQNPDP